MHDSAPEKEADSAATPKPRRSLRRRAPWLAGLFAGIAALAALILFITHAGDITAFARQAANAKAGPLFAAIAVQALPYLITAFVWFLFLHRIGTAVRFISLVPLSFAKLFADQAIPSGGLSGAAFFLFALTQRGVPDKAAFRTFVFTTSAYFLAFLCAAIISLIALSLAENAPSALAASVSAFAGFFVLLTVLAGLAILYKAPMPAFLARRRFGRKAAEFLGAAIGDIRQMPGLFARLALLLLLSRVVDGLTIMLTAQAIGAPVSLFTAFIAVATASIAATIGPVPMGLGTFEAGMIASLSVFGVSVEDALTITLIYRGLTLWLPLLPGFAILQREFLRRPAAAPAPEKTDPDQA